MQANPTLLTPYQLPRGLWPSPNAARCTLRLPTYRENEPQAGKLSKAMNPDTDLSEPLYRVVSAANRHKASGLIICGARHYDDVMRGVIMFICGTTDAAKDQGFYSMEQGFINNKGEFMTRQEAWIIAEKAGQIRQQTGPDRGILYSEDLY